MKTYKIINIICAACAIFWFQSFSINAEELRELYLVQTLTEAPENNTNTEMKPIDEIKQDFFDDETLCKIDVSIANQIKISFENTNKQTTIHNDYVYGSSFGTYDYTTLKRLSDWNWIYNELHRLTGQTNKINSVFYKWYDIPNDTNVYVGENKIQIKLMAYIFTGSELYIMHIPIFNEQKESSAPILVEIGEITTVETYNEWFNDRIFRPEGKLVINGKEVSDKIYCNKYNWTVPFRAVCEAAGAEVTWDADKRCATMQYNGSDIYCEYDFYEEPNNSSGLMECLYGYFYRSEDGEMDCESLADELFFIKDGITYFIECEQSELMKLMSIDCNFDWQTKTLYVTTI